MKNEVTHVEATGRGPFDSLELLCQSGEIPEGMRPYKVKKYSGDARCEYVFSNSPKSAAEACCAVELVKPKELNECLLRMQAKAFRERLEAEEKAGKEQA